MITNITFINHIFVKKLLFAEQGTTGILHQNAHGVEYVKA
jgi:hypothetical protein